MCDSELFKMAMIMINVVVKVGMVLLVIMLNVKM